jgi:hypothetical protein
MITWGHIINKYPELANFFKVVTLIIIILLMTGAGTYLYGRILETYVLSILQLWIW